MEVPTASDGATDEPTVNIRQRKNPSRNKRRHFSDQWSVPSLSKVYCVCRKTWKGEAMIQCDGCDVWYHCSCLQIDPVVCDKFAGNDVQFLCGQSGCNNGTMLLTMPNNAESCGISTAGVTSVSSNSVRVSRDERGGSLSDNEVITFDNFETMPSEDPVDAVLYGDIVFPGNLHCKNCDLWYNCICAKTSTAVCSEFDGTRIEFLCGRRGCNNGNMLLHLPNDISFSASQSASGIVSSNDCLMASLNELDGSLSNSEFVPKQSAGESVTVDMSVSDNVPAVTSTFDTSVNVPADVKRTNIESVLHDEIGSSLPKTDPVVPFSTCVDVHADVMASTSANVSVNDLGNSILTTESANESFDNTDLDAVPHASTKTCTDEDVLSSTLLSTECVEKIIGCPPPQSDVYEQQLQTYAEFDIPCDALSKLRVPNSRYLLRGCWQSVFLDGLKKSNSVCVLCFRYHSVSTCNIVRRSNKVFCAKGYCSVPGCPVEFSLEMYDEVTVHVYYTGNIKHPLCGQWARPIRGLERNRLQQQFAHGRKPFSVYVERLNMKTGSELLAGNFDSIGKSSYVLRKISSEGIHSKQLHADVYQSLLKLQSSANDSVLSHYGIKTFVQSVSIAPVIIHLWTENGVRLYHQLACCNALFLDATGSVVRKIPNCKRILYYEISIRNPSGTGCSIPVAAMLSSDHTISTISNFVQTFRDAEKRIFGFRSYVIPVIVKIDFSMALISSVLMVYNRQDMHEYLQWSWDAVHNCSGARRCRTVVHVCLAHFVKCVKQQCSKLFKSGTELILYTTSLMSAAHNLSDVGELFHDLGVVLCSVHRTNLFTKSFARLEAKIAAYDPKHVILDDMLEHESETDMLHVSDVRGSEDRVMSRCPTSPFLSWASSIYASLVAEIKLHDRAELPQNRFCNAALFEQLMKVYMPTLPLWSSVLVSVYLTADNKCCSHAHKTHVTEIVPRTSGTQEQRFYVLKHLVLGNKSTRRMDEFVQCVHELFTATEKDFVVTYLRKQRKRTSTAASLPVQENWAKKIKQLPCLLNPKLGKYQQPPAKKTIRDLNASTQKISVPVNSHITKINKPVGEHNVHGHESTDYNKKEVVFVAAKFSPMTNFGNTCWFNAAMQALHKTYVCATVIEHFESVVDVDVNPTDRNEPLHTCLCEILRFMTHEAPSPVPHQLILRCISLYNRLFDQRRVGTRTQHDVHEFLTDCIFSLFNKHSVCPKFVQEIQCSTCCEPSSTKQEETCPCLVLTVPDRNVHVISVQQLVDDYFTGHSVSAVCCSAACNGAVRNKIVRNRLTWLPDSIIILLQRYKLCGDRFIKINVNVLVNRYIKLQCTNVNTTDGVKECTFSLCSVVSHAGSSPNHGHYTASILQELQHDSLSFAVCDDSNINIVNTNCSHGNIIQFDDRTVSNAVLLMYNRQFLADKRLLPLLFALRRTTGLASLVDAMQPTSVAAAQQRFMIVSDILSGKHSDTLLSDIIRIARVDITDLCSCKLLLSTLISDLARTLDLRCNTFFQHTSSIVEGRECSNGQTVLFLESHNVIQPQSHSTAGHVRLHFFPDTIFLLCSESEPAQQRLNLTSNIEHVFPSQTLLYEFAGAITWQNSSVVLHDSLSSVGASSSISLYNMNKEMYCCMSIAPNSSHINKHLVCVNLAPFTFTLAQVDLVEQSYCGILLTDTHWRLIMSRQWFTDVIIDSYFTLLARHVSEKVLVYSCSFFNTLFFHQNPDKPKVSLCRKEHSKMLWFSTEGAPLFDFVVIPGSLLNAHFVTVVVDLRTLCIFMCDPMLSSQNKVVSQVARYVCQEYFVSTGTALDVKKLTLINYCTWDSEFPQQHDTHNCGAYICLIAKCIVQNKLLRFQMPQLLRKTVCYELIHNNLL